MTNDSLAALLEQGRVKIALALNDEQRRAVTQWAADDRLWTTQETVEFNLAVFARVILAANR
jgi:hypothetical protein